MIVFLLPRTIINAQSPITTVVTLSANAATATENNIPGAGYSFSSWLTSSTFTVNYSSAATGDILGINNLSTASFSNLTPVAVAGPVAKVNRVANAVITDNRNFITSWNRISAGPLAGAINGTFSCVAPKVASMEAALLVNNFNSGYDNTFQNTAASPHYNNIERVDYIIPTGIVATSTWNQIGAAIFDRGVGDPFKIAVITSVDASNNPTGYGPLVSVAAANFSAAGLLGASFDYTIFVSDPNVGGGQHRPSVRNNQNIRGVFISLQDMGITTSQRVYGYSLFSDDVVTPTHTLTNPATFPTNSNSASMLDLVNITGFFKTNLVVLPVSFLDFTAVNQAPGQNFLQWKINNELDINQYIIERSLNPVNGWTGIGVQPALNNGGNTIYQFTDHQTTGPKTYYRIKIIDKAGQITYSKIIRLSTKQKNTIEINYLQGRLVIESALPVDFVEIRDASGRLIQQYKNNTNDIILTLKIPTMSRGIYFIKVSGKENEVVTKSVLL